MLSNFIHIPSKLINLNISSSASMFLIGMAVGTPLCGIQSGSFGRKKTVMITQLVSFAGSLCILFANTPEMFYLGNFLSGYTNAVFIGIAPVYTSEICQPNIRKFTGSFLAVEFYVGFAIAYFAGSMSTWKTAAIIQAVWPCLVFFLMMLCPESPSWLLSQGRKKLALKTLIDLRGNEIVAVNEMSRIALNNDKQKHVIDAFGEMSFRRRQYEIMKRGTFIRPCLVLTILMAVCWQWTGGNVLILHMVAILNDFEVPIPAGWASAGLGLYQLIGGLSSIAVCSIVSRRKFYVCSGICIFLGNFLLALIVHLKNYEFFMDSLKEYPAISWIPLIALLLYFAGYSMGWVSVCFMLIGELLPSNGREMGSFIAVECSNISATILVKYLPQLKLHLGLDGLFGLFSAVSIFAIVFAYTCVPDTFGKTLEEIEEHYRTVCYGSQTKKKGKITTTRRPSLFFHPFANEGFVVE